MIYLTRNAVCEMLRFGRRQSYRIVGSAACERIASTEILALLNRARVATDALSHFPGDLMTPEETVEFLAGSDVTLHDLRNWTRRTRNVPPHYRFNSHTIRFSRAALSSWLDRRTRIRRCV